MSTPQYIAAGFPSYCDRPTAALYFSTRLRTEDWDYATMTDQDKALAQATTLIDQLNFAGEVAVCGQPLQFPRKCDTLIPTAITNACAEVALALLGEIDVNMEGRSVNVQETKFAAVMTHKDTSFIPDWVTAGIPSMIAWNMLKPFLRDPYALRLERVD